MPLVHTRSSRKEAAPYPLKSNRKMAESMYLGGARACNPQERKKLASKPGEAAAAAPRCPRLYCPNGLAGSVSKAHMKLKRTWFCVC